ncbi:gibberellin 2-beta-dioxygenase 8-like isoform X1 [Miscanthus floridulus]|uniref:gibberellin 2-beta-dioxygenase 8-like isoform X1 n=1 Tax=Miscanthus floridulus TaxID=154761 RepID=UPI003458AE9D
MAPGSESQATAATADPSCPPFPLLEEEDGGHINEQEQEVPRGAELELPTVDLEAPGEALAAACRGLGVFRLANHGVPAALSARLFATARATLAEAPFSDKRAQPGYFWGTPALSLRVRDVNWVEGFHVALGDQQSAPATPLGDLLDLAAEYGAHMARVARTLFDALAAPLGLDAGQAATYLAERNGFLRVYRYPRCPEPGRLGMEAHTDSSVLSVINQDAVGGLQVHHDGAWRDVAPGGGETGTLLVNLGDMAQAISGDAYCSVRHRVAASQAAERLSLCYFAFPRDDAVISCAGGRYRPFTYAGFREQVQADIKATGSKVLDARVTNTRAPGTEIATEPEPEEADGDPEPTEDAEKGDPEAFQAGRRTRRPSSRVYGPNWV